MQNYLSGYLSVLPLIQRKRVIELLKRNEDYKYAVVSSDEFNALIDQITEEHSRATEYIPQSDRLDSERYNDFFSKVYTDLHFIFNESNLVDRALKNYYYLSSSELSNLNKEIVDLRTQIDNLKKVSTGEDGLIVRTETFHGSTFEEDPDGAYADLFCDRDGTPLPKASVSLNNRKKTLSLKMNNVIDRIHNSNGMLNASAELLDQRGYDKNMVASDLNKILDGSNDTYWSATIHTNEEINLEMYGVKGPGAMAKILLTFTSPTMVSEISLTPFGIYPLEVAAILYEQEVEYTANSNTVPPNQKYIMVSPEVRKLNPGVNTLIEPNECISSDTMIFSIPNTLIKRIIFIVKQRNFVEKNNTTNGWDMEKSNLWDIISSSDILVDKDKERFNLYLKSVEGGYERYVE